MFISTQIFSMTIKGDVMRIYDAHDDIVKFVLLKLADFYDALYLSKYGEYKGYDIQYIERAKTGTSLFENFCTLKNVPPDLGQDDLVEVVRDFINDALISTIYSLLDLTEGGENQIYYLVKDLEFCPHFIENIFKFIPIEEGIPTFLGDVMAKLSTSSYTRLTNCLTLWKIVPDLVLHLDKKLLHMDKIGLHDQ